MTEGGVRRSIALVIRESGGEVGDIVGCGPGERWLLVRRPPDDDDLPDIWGLPAGTARPSEAAEDLVRRIGRDKLGVVLDPGASVASGSAERAAYRLDMELWTATIEAGEPEVPPTRAPDDGATRYTAWKWDDPSALEDGARKGSLCCRLGVRLV